MIASVDDIKNAMRAFSDEGYSGFRGFPNTFSKAISDWADLADIALSDVIPASNTQKEARAAFEAQMSTLSDKVDGVLLLQNAFLSYAIALAPGMVISSYTGTPPIGPPPIKATLGAPTMDAEGVAFRIATVINTWAKSGTAIPVAGGPPINWN